jgi:hypothetical protein
VRFFVPGAEKNCDCVSAAVMLKLQKSILTPSIDEMSSTALRENGNMIVKAFPQGSSHFSSHGNLCFSNSKTKKAGDFHM